jgi:hypothetical protein
MPGGITKLVLDSFMPTYQQENCRDYRVSASRGAHRAVRGALRVRLGLCSSLASLALLCLAPHGAAAAAIEPGEVQVSTPVYQLPADVEWPDERWDYHFSWSGIPVGTLSIEAGGQPAEDGDTDGGDSGKRLTVHVLGTTNSVVDLLWKYRLDARGVVAVRPFSPREFIIDETERRKDKFTHIRFDADRNVHSIRRKNDKTREYRFAGGNTFDILSTVFLILNLDYVLGDEFYVDTFTGTSRYLVTVNVDAKEEQLAAGASVPAWRLSVHTHELTDPEKDGKHRETILWVSRDKPRRLLAARSKTFVGAIEVDLDAVVPARELERTAGAEELMAKPATRALD